MMAVANAYLLKGVLCWLGGDTCHLWGGCDSTEMQGGRKNATITIEFCKMQFARQ